MVVSAADHAKFKWTHAKIGLVPETQFKCRPGIFVLQHGVLFRRDRRPCISEVPGFKVRELVLRGQKWMGFAVALHLGDLEQRFPAAAHLGVRLVDRFSIAHGFSEHYTIADVAVMRDGQCLTTGSGFVCRKEIPQVLRMDAIEGRKRQYLLHPIWAVTENNDAVKIVAVRGRAPLIAIEGGEHAGGVELGGNIHDSIPHAALELRICKAFVARRKVVHYRNSRQPCSLATLR